MFENNRPNKLPGQIGGTTTPTPQPPEGGGGSTTTTRGLLRKAPPANITPGPSCSSIDNNSNGHSNNSIQRSKGNIDRPTYLSLPTPPPTPSALTSPSIPSPALSTASTSTNTSYLSASTSSGRYSTVRTVRTTTKGHPSLLPPAQGLHSPESAHLCYSAYTAMPASITSSTASSSVGDDFSSPSPPASRPSHHRSHSSTGNADSLQLPNANMGGPAGGANAIYGNSRYSRSFNALTPTSGSTNHSSLFSSANNRTSMRLVDNFEQVYSSNIKSLSGRNRGSGVGESPDASRPGTAKSFTGKKKVVPVSNMLTFRWVDGANEVESYHYGPLGRGDRVPDLYLITGDVEVYVEMSAGEWSTVPVFKIKESPLMHMIFEKQITYATDDDQEVGLIREPQITLSTPTLAVPEDDLTFNTLASRSSTIGAARPVSTLMSLDYSHLTKRGRSGGEEPSSPPLRPAILQTAEDGAEEIVESQAKYRIHVPFPADLEGANNILQYFIDLRNLFAFLDQQYLVGCQIGRLTPAASLAGVHDFIFKRIMNGNATPEWEKVFYESVEPFFQFQVQELDLTDVRNNPEQMVAVLAVAEKWKNVSLYSVAFAHLLGNWEHCFKLSSNSVITSQLSMKSRQLLEKNIFELNARISTMEERLREFQFHSITHNLASNSEYPNAWIKGYQTMRKFYMKHLKHKFGNWPPKAHKPGSKTANSGLDVLDGGINRVVIRECYWDMTRLYTLLVNTQEDYEGKTFELKDNLDSNGLLGKVLHEFDEERPPVQPHIPFLLPLTPEIPKEFEKKKAKRSEPFLQWFNNEAYNPTGSEKILESLTDGLKKIEADTKGSDVLEQRRGMWIFIYAVLQTLVRGLDLPSVLAQSSTEALKGVSYFLCQSNGDQVPWIKTGSGSRPISFGGSGLLSPAVNPRGEQNLSDFEKAYTSSFIWQENEKYRQALREKRRAEGGSITESESLYETNEQADYDEPDWNSNPVQSFEALSLQNLDYPQNMQHHDLTPLDPPPMLRETMPGYIDTTYSSSGYGSRRGSAAGSGGDSTPTILRAGSPRIWANGPPSISSGPNTPPLRPGSSGVLYSPHTSQQFPPRGASHQLPPLQTSRPTSGYGNPNSPGIEAYPQSPQTATTRPDSNTLPFAAAASAVPAHIQRPTSAGSSRPFSRGGTGTPPPHFQPGHSSTYPPPPINTSHNVSGSPGYQAYSPVNSRPSSRSGSVAFGSGRTSSRRNSTLLNHSQSPTVAPLFSNSSNSPTGTGPFPSPIRLVESPVSMQHIDRPENRVSTVNEEIYNGGGPRVDLDFGFDKVNWEEDFNSTVTSGQDVKDDVGFGMAR